MIQLLDSCITKIYSGHTNTFLSFENCYYNSNYVQMSIPITSLTFELPTFMLDSLTIELRNGRRLPYTHLVPSMYYKDKTSKYKSLDSIMRSSLYAEFYCNGLVHIEVKQGNTSIPYFITSGAVFNKDLDCLAMCSWEIEKKTEFCSDKNSFGTDILKEVVTYHAVKPVLRVSDSCYLEKDDPMKRYIVNKLINTCIYKRVTAPPILHGDISHNIEIRIGAIPFDIHRVSTPSISTTRESLMQTVLNHIDDLI